MEYGLSIFIGAMLGLVVFWGQKRLQHKSLRLNQEASLQKVQKECEEKLEAAQRDAKEQLLNLQLVHEQQENKQKDELIAYEKRVKQNKEQLLQKLNQFERKIHELQKRENNVLSEERRLNTLLHDAEQKLLGQKHELERISGLSKAEAEQELLISLKEQAKEKAALKIIELHKEAEKTAEEKATQLLAETIQRMAGSFVAEKTVTVVELPSDDMKGRIIGREGRNIRTLEALTGVDVIIDDTPNVVVVSGFNPLRREIAKMALERLVDDGRIHPARIEEVVALCVQEMDEWIVQKGEQAVLELGLHGMHPELIKLVGQLRYRQVNGQNIWEHAVETAHLTGFMAAELGLNAQIAKRAGLLHDIGQALDHEHAGDHAAAGAEQARRYGEKPAVVSAILEHHQSKSQNIYAVLVKAADLLSKSRKGARKESWDNSIQRLHALEHLCLTFKGVEKAYALQAGREVYVMVDALQVLPEQTFLLAEDIAARIENELTYSGEVRVTVVREARATEIAR